MIFEGSEKKCELVVNSDLINLLEIDDSFWSELVSKCNATILSKIENKNVKAYLLSESSLFVWKDYFLLITCGQTTLVDAISYFIDHKGKECVEQLIFQRKNEYFSFMQPTTFFDDVKKLREQFDGQAFRFGNIDGHHNYLFHIDSAYVPSEEDKTYELLMYDIQKEATDFLTKEGHSKSQLREYLKLNEIIPGFEVDDFVFDPYGYSLNAINEDGKYLTIHITPQESSSYISFEANFNLIEKAQILLDNLRPNTFDLIAFNSDNMSDIKEYIPNAYNEKRKVQGRLDCGHVVTFTHFYKQLTETLKPQKL